MDAQSSQALSNGCPSSKDNSMGANTTSGAQTNNKRPLSETQHSPNSVSPAHSELADVQSPSSFVEPKVDGKAGIPTVKRRRLLKDTSQGPCDEEEEEAGTGVAEMDTRNTLTQGAASASGSGTSGEQGRTDHSLRRMPPQTLPLRLLFRRGGGDLSLPSMQLQSDRAEQSRPSLKALTFHRDQDHYHSDSEDSVRFPTTGLPRRRDYGFEREREGGYDADVEDAGARYENEYLDDSGLVFGELDSGDDEEEEEEDNEDHEDNHDHEGDNHDHEGDKKDHEGDVNMNMG